MQTPNRNYNGRNNFMRPLKMSLDNWIMASLSGFFADTFLMSV